MAELDRRAKEYAAKHNNVDCPAAWRVGYEQAIKDVANLLRGRNTVYWADDTPATEILVTDIEKMGE
jgi:hypothetical protein